MFKNISHKIFLPSDYFYMEFLMRGAMASVQLAAGLVWGKLSSWWRIGPRLILLLLYTQPFAVLGHHQPSSQVPQPTCLWKWHSWQLGNLTNIWPDSTLQTPWKDPRGRTICSLHCCQLSQMSTFITSCKQRKTQRITLAPPSPSLGRL